MDSSSEPAQIMGIVAVANMPPKAREAYELGNRNIRERFRAERAAQAGPIYASAAFPVPAPVSDAQTFARMPPLARARLSQHDPKRYRRLRAAWDGEAAQLGVRLRAAKTLAQRQEVLGQIAELGAQVESRPR